MIVIEESGIAKGIRRIVAYTGDAAHQAQREARLFGEKLDRLDAMPFSAEKDRDVKAASVELASLAISTLTKEELKSRFGKIQKEILDELKKRQKAESKTALDTVQGHFKKDENKESNWFVGHLPISANAKAISDVITYYKTKDKERSVYIFAGSKEDSVMHGVYVGTVSQSEAPSSLHESLC